MKKIPTFLAVSIHFSNFTLAHLTIPIYTQVIKSGPDAAERSKGSVKS